MAARVKEVDTIIWDEAGMSVKRIFQLVNVIHHELSKAEESGKPFGCKQQGCW